MLVELAGGLFAGRFLAELTKQVFADLAASKYQVIALFWLTILFWDIFVPNCFFEFAWTCLLFIIVTYILHDLNIMFREEQEKYVKVCEYDIGCTWCRWQSTGFPSMGESRVSGISWQAGLSTMSCIVRMLCGLFRYILLHKGSLHLGKQELLH